MQICVLQATCPDGHILHEHDEYADPGRYVKQHNFHHRFIDKANYRQRIDAAVAEKLDSYINFMWGQPEDEVAGVETTEYFESLNVPFIGLRGRILRKSKADLYDAARKKGSPPVPSADPDVVPVIVKAARSCASQFLSDKSICFTAEERDAAIANIDRPLQPGRLRALPPTPPLEMKPATVYDLPDDIIVQEFIPGIDYSVVVIEFGKTPITLNPTIYNYPSSEDASNNLVNRDDDPELFDTLQRLAVEAFQANDMAGGSWGNVDIRIKPDGKPVVIEVNPMPAVFLPLDFGYEETVIWNSSPGEHRALLNIMMASYMMRSETYDNVRQDLIGKVYNRVALQYDAQYNPQSSAEEVFGRLLSKFNFDGSLLDIACGTGLFGRLIRAEQHIMCYQAIRFVSAFEVSLVLSRCFQLANKSVTIGVDEIPEAYNEAIKKLPPPNNVMTSINHVQEVRDFEVPRGWKLALEEQVFGWKSPNTNVDVNTTLFHFEQI
ncbi:ATP-grasp domain-containing protein [Fusarium sp. Ph1]|nr:ATP-grasp domain-containing protein [Fusarium sp. Ph1]